MTPPSGHVAGRLPKVIGTTAIVLNIAVLLPHAVFLIFVAFSLDCSPGRLAWLGALVPITAVLSTMAIAVGLRARPFNAWSIGTAIACFAVVVLAITDVGPVTDVEDLLSCLEFYSPPIVIPVLSVWTMFLLRRPWTSKQCSRCGYDLTGLKGQRCPECGHERRGPS